MKYILLSSLLFISILSCKKEGCTDGDATNFSMEAEKDDATCEYQSSITFWYTSLTSGGMVFGGATLLSFYVDNELIGTKDPYIYWDNAPQCMESGTIFTTKSLGLNKTQSFTWAVKDQTGKAIYSGIWNATANSCLIEVIN